MQKIYIYLRNYFKFETKVLANKQGVSSPLYCVDNSVWWFVSVHSENCVRINKHNCISVSFTDGSNCFQLLCMLLNICTC